MRDLTILQRVVSRVILYTNWMWAHRLENWLIIRAVNRDMKAFPPEVERSLLEYMNDSRRKSREPTKPGEQWPQ